MAIKRASLLPPPLFCCKVKDTGLLPLKRCARRGPTGGRGPVLVCRTQHPKKENFKIGRGGKELSINATECPLGQTTPHELLFRNYCFCLPGRLIYSQRLTFLFSHPIK